MKMKQLILRSFFLLLISGLAFSSCKKDSSGDATIVGTWTAGTVTTDIKVGELTLTQYYIDVVGLSEADAATYAALIQGILVQTFTGTITIKSDNTYTDNLGGTTETGTWSLNSDQTMITITPTGEVPMTFDVVELTSSKLIISGTETMPQDLNDDGTDEILTIKIDITFTK